MKIFTDNTSLHRLGHVIDACRAGHPIPPTDALTVFHFVEAVLFYDSVIYSDFEPASVQARSLGLADSVNSEAGGPPIIETFAFDEHDYAAACTRAGRRFCELVAPVDDAAINNVWADDADGFAAPDGVSSSKVTQWLDRTWTEQERGDVAKNALEQQAAGAFDFVIGGDSRVYEAVQRVGESGAPRIGERAAASLIQMLLRISINEELAVETSTLYMPSAERAKGLYALEIAIRENLRSTGPDDLGGTNFDPSTAFDILQRIARREQLPLRGIALPILEHAGGGSPGALLEAVAKLASEHPHVAETRRWLREWEHAYAQGEDVKCQEAREEMDRIRADLDPHPLDMSAIVRVPMDASRATFTGEWAYVSALCSSSDVLGTADQRIGPDHRLFGVLEQKLGARIN